MNGLLPLDEQLSAFQEALSRNEVLTEVLLRSASLGLPGWYLTAGCLFQTVWNVATGRQPAHGIKDYDLFYFDAADLSWDAEDRVIQTAGHAFGDLPAEVEIRNEARVHLWYQKKFGTPCPPYTSTEDAIDSFTATTCCLGVRLEPAGGWRVYAPHGLSDVFNLVVRPNPVLAPRSVYEAKTSRWRRQWPELTVLPWPAPASSLSLALDRVDSGADHGGAVRGRQRRDRRARVLLAVEDYDARADAGAVVHPGGLTETGQRLDLRNDEVTEDSMAVLDVRVRFDPHLDHDCMGHPEPTSHDL